MSWFLGEDEGSVEFRLKWLRKADRERVGRAAQRYAEIATTLRTAVGRLEKVVSAGSEGMRGEAIDAIREDARHARDKLDKAAIRYEDAAREIAIYLPELDTATEEVRRAQTEAEEARSSLAAATGLPDGVPGDDGALSDEERAKDDEKLTRTTQAQDAAAAARARMEQALGQLDRAGRRLGDNVNAKRYDDGLSDSAWDDFLHVLGYIGKVLTAIGIALAVLCIFFPGVAALVLAAFVVAAASLVSTSILYAYGKEGLADLALAIVGVLTFGIGFVFSTAGKALNAAGHMFDEAGGLIGFITRVGRGAGRPSGGLGIELRTAGQAADDLLPVWRNQSDWFNNRWVNDLLGRISPLLKPNVGLWQSSKEQWASVLELWSRFPGQKWATIGHLLGTGGGWSGYTARVTFLATTNQVASWTWIVWGGLSAAFGIGSGIYGAGRMPEEGGFPTVGEKVQPW